MNKSVKYILSHGYRDLRIIALTIFMLLSIFATCKCCAFDAINHPIDIEPLDPCHSGNPHITPSGFKTDADLMDEEWEAIAYGPDSNNNESSGSESHEDRCGSSYSPND